jgi:hypothetical protein
MKPRTPRYKTDIKLIPKTKIIKTIEERVTYRPMAHLHLSLRPR